MSIPKRKPVALTLPLSMADELDSVSRRTDIPKTRLIERAVAAYFNEHYPPALPKTPRTTHVQIDPASRDVVELLEKDKAGYPLFTKDLLPYHVKPAHLYATEVSEA